MRLTKLLGSVLSALQVRTQSALLNESTLGTLLGSDGSWFETNIWTTAVIPCLPSDSASNSLYIFVISMYSSARANNDAWQQQSPCIIERWCMAATASMHHQGRSTSSVSHPTPMMHGSNGVHASSKDDAWPRLRPCIISKEPTHAAVKVSQIFNTNILRSPFNEEEGRRLTQWSGRTPKRQAAFKRRVHTSTRGNNCSSTA